MNQNIDFVSILYDDHDSAVDGLEIKSGDDYVLALPNKILIMAYINDNDPTKARFYVDPDKGKISGLTSISIEEKRRESTWTPKTSRSCALISALYDFAPFAFDFIVPTNCRGQLPFYPLDKPPQQWPSEKIRKLIRVR